MFDNEAQASAPVIQFPGSEGLLSEYFSELRKVGSIDADPSGWLDTRSASEDMLTPPQFVSSDYSKYLIDDGHTLGSRKTLPCSLLSEWDQSPIGRDEVTLCSSGSMASLLTLSALKENGIKRLLIETPSFFGTVDQARELGLETILVPTYKRDDYSLPDIEPYLRASAPTALWLTQPRIALGYNQDRDALDGYLERLRNCDALVSDEVTDQSFPSHLGSLRSRPTRATVIRLRAFTKPMGINGLRLYAAIHDAALRGKFIRGLDLFGGTLDAHSLLSIEGLANDLPRFRAMLSAANRQVIQLREKAERLARGSRVSVNHLVNGYLGSMCVDCTALGADQSVRRMRLLEKCKQARTPIILGTALYAAPDPPLETVRLNFFLRDEHVLCGIQNISRIVA